VEWSGVEGRGATPVSHADEVDQDEGGMESRRWQAVKSRTYVAHTSEKGGLGLNPNRPRGSAS
jgi:hypothetical protein